MRAFDRGLTPEARLAQTVDRGSGDLWIEQKPYIQPFERRLAGAELRGLCGEELSFDAAPTQVLVDTRVSPDHLRGRLAYWQRMGENAEPTRQVELEASMLKGDAKVPTKRLLRYGPHGLHEYRGKFFPQLVRALINAADLSEGSLVLDPMSGSGTTACEARALGMRAIGLDLNPLSVHLARVKSSLLEFAPEHLAGATEEVLGRVDAAVDERPAWSPADQPYLERWFDPAALRDIAKIQAVLSMSGEPRLRAFFETCLSSVLRRISWQKEVDLRVRKEVEAYEAGAALDAFSDAVSEQTKKLRPYLALLASGPTLPTAELKEGDARRAHEHLSEVRGRVDLLITSPPYATALPYLDTDRLSLCVLGLLPRSAHRERETDMVGTREIGERQRARHWQEYLDRKNLLPTRARQLIDSLAEVNHGPTVGFRRRNLPALLGKYFLDMRGVLESTRKLMRPDALSFWVVGNNSTQVAGQRIEIPTDELLWELGESVGWTRTDQIGMELLDSRDIFRKNRGSAESILGFRAGLERVAVYGGGVADAARGGLGEDAWDFHGVETQEHLHSLHPYPARFIPQIPRSAIERWTEPGELVLDPFAGGGTTLLEASLAGRPSVGVDNNDVAHLVARAKTAQYEDEDLRELRELASRLTGDLAGVSPWIPDYPNRDHWFCGQALEDLGRLRTLVDEMGATARTLGLAVLSALVVRASRQDSDTRYARVDRNYVAGSAIKRGAERLRAALARIEALQGQARSRARAPVASHRRDGRDLGFLPDESVKLVVTSPPYLNAYDYHKYHRHRLHWIGGDVAMARDLEIGKHDTFTRPRADPERYFRDMAACMREWARVLVPGGRVVMVIGDAIVGGRAIAVGDRLAEDLAGFGIETEARWLRSLDTTRKSFNQRARIDREHVILARRTSEDPVSP